jgi:hypothetical protein
MIEIILTGKQKYKICMMNKYSEFYSVLFAILLLLFQKHYAVLGTGLY